MSKSPEVKVSSGLTSTSRPLFLKLLMRWFSKPAFSAMALCVCVCLQSRAPRAAPLREEAEGGGVALSDSRLNRSFESDLFNEPVHESIVSFIESLNLTFRKYIVLEHIVYDLIVWQFYKHAYERFLLFVLVYYFSLFIILVGFPLKHKNQPSESQF